MLNIFDRLFGRREQPFHSKFGGLWIDRAKADKALVRRRAAGKIDNVLQGQIDHFMRNGYVILEQAVSHEAIDDLTRVVKSAYGAGDARLRYHTDGREHHVLDSATDPRGKRIVEAHAPLAEVRRLLTVPPVIGFLRAIFEEVPVLTQTLIFYHGSEQGYHQDPAFVVFDQPLKMAAAWVALEDIEEDSGELQYIVGSHRLPDYVFSTGRRDSHGAQPGEVDAFGKWLVEECDRRGLNRQRFRAKKGDVLLWHADLAHGGSAIKNPGTTRLSLVGHFCPVSVKPVYPNADIRRAEHGLEYSSYLYDVNANP